MIDFRVTISGNARRIVMFRADGEKLPNHFRKNSAGDWQTTVREHPEQSDGHLNVKVFAAGVSKGAECKMVVKVLNGKKKSGRDETKYDDRRDAILIVDVIV